MAVCERCGNVGGGVTCALCGALLPEHAGQSTDQTLVRPWIDNPDAAGAASADTAPTQLGPALGWAPERAGQPQSQPTPQWPGQIPQQAQPRVEQGPPAFPPQPAVVAEAARSGPVAQSGPSAQPWAPWPRRRPVLPIAAGVAALALVGVVAWQLPGLLGRSQGATPTRAAATVTITAPAATTPVLPQAPVTVPQVPAAAAGPAAQPTPLYGTFGGLGRQAGGTKARVWSIKLGFTGSVGTITYRESADAPVYCAGTLTLRPDGDWVERITAGGCDDGGTWSFAGTGPLRGAYTDPDGTYGLTGEFSYLGE
nr:hypothetical protein [Propionibacterium sp.]